MWFDDKITPQEPCKHPIFILQQQDIKPRPGNIFLGERTNWRTTTYYCSFVKTAAFSEEEERENVVKFQIQICGCRSFSDSRQF